MTEEAFSSNIKLMPGNNKGFIHLLVLVGVLGVAGLFLASNMQLTEKFVPNQNIKGALIAKGGDDNSLGDSDSSNSGSSHEGVQSDSGSGSVEKQQESVKKADELQKEQLKKTNELSKEVEKKKLEAVKKSLEKEHEASEEAEVDMEDEKEVETELEKAGVQKIHFRNKQGHLEAGVEEASGSAKTISLNSKQKIKINLANGLENEVEIDVQGDNFTIKTNKQTAVTKFPIFLDETSGQLFVSTSNGPKAIRVLPEQAAEIATVSGVQSLTGKIDISQSGDKAVFKVAGIKSGRLFGLVPLNTEVQTEVDTQTGTILGVEGPLWLRFLYPFID